MFESFQIQILLHYKTNITIIVRCITAAASLVEWRLKFMVVAKQFNNEGRASSLLPTGKMPVLLSLRHLRTLRDAVVDDLQHALALLTL